MKYYHFIVIQYLAHTILSDNFCNMYHLYLVLNLAMHTYVHAYIMHTRLTVVSRAAK